MSEAAGTRVGDILAEIVAGTAHTGHAFFESLVFCLSRALHVRYALVGELLEDTQAVRTVGLCADGALQPAIEYALRGTPCANVMGGQVCYFPSGVASLFPEDALLRDMGVESYLGVPLRSSMNRPIGLLVVLHDAPIEADMDPAVVLQIFAGRAAAELERLDHERELERRTDLLRLSEEMFSSVFRASPAAMTVSDMASGRIVDVNDAFTRSRGLARDEVIGRTSTEAGIWDSEADRAAFVEAAQAGTARDLLLDVPGRAERRLLLRASAEVVEIAGRPHLVTMSENVTDRLHAELALKRSEERLRLALDAARMGAWEWEVAADRVGWSDRENRVCGFPEGTSIQTIADYLARVHPEDRLVLRKAVDGALSGERDPYLSEHRVAQAGGGYRWVESRAKVSRDARGRPLRLAGTLADIDERKRTEAELTAGAERLRRSEEMFSKVFRSSPVPIVIARQAMRGFVDVNDAMLETCGFSREQVIGQSGIELGLWDQGARDRFVQEFAVAGRLRDRPAEFTTPRGRLSMLLSVELIRIGDEDLFLVMAQDVTERMKAEADLRTAARAEARLRDDLRRQETLAAMGSLVAGVAHEVRTPLFSISATVDAFEGGPPEEMEEGTRLLRAQVKRLSALMSDLLDYGRPPALQLEWGGIVEVAERAMRGCEEMARQAGVTMLLEQTQELAPLRRDARRLEQAFQNLLANAVQHSPGGGLVRLVLGLAARGDFECRVEDDGPGLAPEALPRVFEPFFTKRKGGTGLGLPIVQRIVEAHGGHVAAANRPDGGAVFTLTLPGGPGGEGARA